MQQIADLFSVPSTTLYGHLDPASTARGHRPARSARSETRREDLTDAGAGRHLYDCSHVRSVRDSRRRRSTRARSWQQTRHST